MKSALTGLVLAIFAVAPSAAEEDWGHLYGYVDWTSDYRFFGASESNRHSVEQGGLHWAAPDNFYAGAFVTGVDFKDFRNTSYEVDLYGGRHFYFGANDINLEALYSFDPDTAGHPSYAPPGVILPTYNFFSASAELTHVFGALSASGRAIVEPRPDSHGGLVWSLTGAANYAIGDWLSAGTHLDYQSIALGTKSTYWDVGVTADWHRQWVLDLRYYATDIRRAGCFDMNWCEPTVVAKITYNFIAL